MTNFRILLIIVVFGFIIIGCGLISEDTPHDPVVVTDKITPDKVTIPVVKESPTSPEVEVSQTTEPLPVVTEEDQQIHSGQLSDVGPWWTFSTGEGFYATNPDSSGLTQFSKGPVRPRNPHQILAAPTDGHLAYLTGEGADAVLNITKFPDLTGVLQKPLFSDQGEPEMEAVRAILEIQSIAFSPDGRFLAFMGAIDGPTSDLYLYSLDTTETTRLTDGPSQAYQPAWSPDGKYIVHTGVSTFGTGAGLNMVGIWAVRTDDLEVLTLFDPSGSGSERIIGWVDDHTFVVYSWDAVCGPKDLRTFNIESKKVSYLWSESFRAVAFDPSNAVAVLSSNGGDCSPAGGAGFYRVPADGSAPMRILDETGPLVIWSQDANLFLASGDFGSWFIAIDSNGQFIDLDKPLEASVFPAVAPGSRDLAWTGKSLWIGPLLGSIDNPPQEIFSEPVYTVTWTPDGQSVIFFADSGLYIAHKPDYAPVLIDVDLDNRNGYSGWVLP